jgi:hypothetical protein
MVTFNSTPAATIPELPPAIAALLNQGAGADLEQKRRVAKLLQPMTPQALVGTDQYIAGAVAGMIYLPRGADSHLLVKPNEGFVFQPISSTVSFNEWAPDRGGLIEMHPKRPSDAQWLKPPAVQREGDYRPNGNSVEKTLNVLMLVYGQGEPFGVFFPYHGKAGFNPAYNAMARAGNTRLSGMSEGNCAVSLIKMTAKNVNNNNHNYWVPVFDFLGKYGEKGGPSLAQLERGLTLRARFLETQAAPWSDEEPETLPVAPAPKPVAPAAAAPPRFTEPRNDEPPLPEPPNGPDSPDQYIVDDADVAF